MAISSEWYSLFLFSSDGIIPYRNDAFHLSDGQEYTVRIYNHSHVNTINATVEIDGRSIGVFRINPNTHAEIKRPVDRNRLLTFYSFESEEGKMAGIRPAHSGSIVVTINKVERTTHVAPMYAVCDGPCEADCRGGGTGLGRFSSQKFTEAEWLPVSKHNAVVLMGNMRLKGYRRVVPL